MNNGHTGTAEKRDLADVERFTWLERKNDDFPFYNGQPVWFSARQWSTVLVAVVLGFIALITLEKVVSGSWALFIPATLFFVIPLAALAFVTPGHWTSLFRKPRLRDFMWMLGFALINIVVTLLIGVLLQGTLGVNDNPVFAELASQSRNDHLRFFLMTIPQLFGEELFTILPFLALLTLFSATFGWSRRKAIVAAWLLSALWFGAAHLPTYDWNVVQSLGLIGSARLILLLPYIMSKSIWVSMGAHILNDWMILISVLAIGAAGADIAQ